MRKICKELDHHLRNLLFNVEVNIHYKDGENVIHRGDFIANAGEITAVVCPSGEGNPAPIPA